MNTPISQDTYVELLTTLERAIAERRIAENQLHELQQERDNDDFDLHEIDEQLHRLETDRSADIAAAEEEHSQLTTALEFRYEQDLEDVEASAKRETAEEEELYQLETARVEGQYDENTWIMSSLVDETADNNPKKQLETFRTQIERREERLAHDCEELKSMTDEACQLVQSRNWQDEEFLPERGPAKNRSETETRFDDAAREARRLMEKLRSQTWPRLVSGTGIIWIGLILWGTSFGAMAALLQPEAIGLKAFTPKAWILTSAGATLAVSGTILMILNAVASQKTWNVFEPLRIHVNDAFQNYKQWKKIAKSELARVESDYEKRHLILIKHREKSLAKFRSERDEKLDALTNLHEEKLANIEAERISAKSSIKETYQQDCAKIEADHQNRLTRIDRQFNKRRQELVGELEQHQQERAKRIHDCHLQLEYRWNGALNQLRRTSDLLSRQSHREFPSWAEILDDDWQPATEVPDGIRLGTYQVDFHRIPEGQPSEITKLPLASAVPFPAVLPFPHSPSIVLKATEAGRSQAVSVLQTAVLRVLAGLPPATVRLTICDPVGLGEPFSAFMHLADFDELLITNRIWTEASHIEGQLAKLTEHLENVFQKYLRNEFETIEEYNEKAGEVAEPYRVLVVAGFPHGFSERSAQRLASIASSGPRCGVYVLMSVDTRQPMPRGFELADVESNATVFRWEDGGFLTNNFGEIPLPLVPEPPPEPTDFTNLVRKFGELSQAIRHVEVPFHRISPDDNDLWQADSRKTLEVALGRSGATKLQNLELGRGTSQHVLIAGKTGSGKSTLLHVLVTNLALNYSPDEVEFYLIDFKKGVEFKTYSTLRLPHARVIAIESDREFGLSVLERLDGILKERGELFREHGAQDIQSLRNANPDLKLPRILLVVDEFQEFFTEDDRVFQTASLLLDRLVRQGRAFGIHVLLGSQTLGGAYSLARTTISQMAVRIALQCSESDAHLILSEDNTAARLLTRPGEAIYNDANGTLEGNSLFQIAWLGDDQREKLLRPLAERARIEGRNRSPMIVFEGNLPADPARNHELNELIANRPETCPTILQSWLGEPVSIAKPTRITFRPQPGSHLLIVGNELNSASGLITNCLISLLTQISVDEDNPSPAVYLFNGHFGEKTADQPWQWLKETLPDRIEDVELRDVGKTIKSLREEVQRRLDDSTNIDRPIFVTIFDLSKFRELFKSDDDFSLGGFGGSDKPPSPSKLFGEILREGSAVGVHVIVWCNTYNNVDRAVGRQMLREFESRVALQMSTSDSSSLIDNPVAGRLGPNRAILYRDDQGSTEKFRPYGMPSEDWLEWVGGQLAAETHLDTPETLDALDDISDITVS